MALQYKELEPFVLQVTGERELIDESYKYVEVDGERYSKIVRNRVTCNYDELYKKGELSLRTFDVFDKILKSKVSVYIFQPHDFAEINRCAIQSEYGNILTSILDFYGIENYWGKGDKTITEYNFTSNKFPINIDTYAGCSSTAYFSYQEIVKMELLGELKTEVKSSLRITQRMKNLFEPTQNDFQKIERLMAYNDLRFDYCELEDDLL